jgi:uncharacterized membrane protein YfcA
MPLASLLPDAPWYVLVAVPFIVLAAYGVFGATGFGSSIIAVPMLAHGFPLTFAVPLATALDAGATSALFARVWRRADWTEFRQLMPAILIGIALGATLLVRLPREPALLGLGLFVTLYGLYLLLGPRSLRMAPSWLAWPLGVIGGLLSAVFGTGGPIYMVYLSARIHDKTVLRATSAVIVTVSVWIRVGVFVVTGLLLHAPLLVLAVAMLPVMALALKLGNRLHHALSGAGVFRLIALLLVGNGLSLIIPMWPLLRGV